MDSTPQQNGSGPEGLLAEYEAAGIKLVRLDAETKKPVDAGWPEKRIPLEEITKYVGGGGNVGWQMGAVSGWVSAVDLDCAEARLLGPKFLPGTLQLRKGEELPSVSFYRSPGLGHAAFNDLGSDRIIDLKASANGKGHQVCVEPSMHLEKGPYKFVDGFDPQKIMEVSSEELREQVGQLAVATLIARSLPQRGRHDLALALAGYLLRNGETPKVVYKILSEAWRVNNAPADGLKDLEGIVKDTATKLQRDEPVKGGRTLEDTIPGMPQKVAKFLGWERAEVEERRRAYARTDMGNAERLVDRHGKGLGYIHSWHRYLAFDGQCWRVDDTGAVRRAAKDTVRSIYGEAAHAPDDATRKAIAKHALASESRNRIDAMTDLAKDEVSVSPKQLDADPWLLNVLNGTVDLRTGERLPHSRADLITKIAQVRYDPGAKAPVFEEFLETVLPSEALRKFVQKAIGYSLTGDVSEQVLLFLYGTGSNGKSTLLNVVHEIAGEYAMPAAPDLLVAKRGSHPTELAALHGVRFAPCTEVEDGARLAESLVKQLTGGDKITARRMREDFWQFSPTHKIWLAANHKPEIRGSDYAIWRRIKMVPFTVTIPKADQDPRLPEKLKEEMPGILDWAVRGCLEWQAEGLGEPREVTQATDSYRAESDLLAAFIDERCVVEAGATVKFSDLWGAWQDWCRESGEDSGTKMKFGKRLDEQGVEKRSGNRNVAMRAGLRLLDEGSMC